MDHTETKGAIRLQTKMGTILTLIRNAIESVKKFNETVSGMRQNIRDIRKCSKDIASIVYDLKAISHEVKDAVKDCSSELQEKMCEQIYTQLSKEDIENIHHVIFYNEFIKQIERMRKTDGEILNGDILLYLLEETACEVTKHKKELHEDDGRYRLLVEIEKFLEINTHFEEDSIQSSEGKNQMTTIAESTEAGENSTQNEELNQGGETWIQLKTLGVDGNTTVKYQLESQQKERKRKWNLANICKWRRKNKNDGTVCLKTIKAFSSLLNQYNQLSKMLKDHLSKTSFDENHQVNGQVLKSILQGENMFEIQSETYTPCMAKFNSQLERVIKRHDLTKINIKVKINADINLKEALEILGTAARRVTSARDDIIDNTKTTRTVLITDIKSFYVDEPSYEQKQNECLEMIPFKNTMSLLKEKSSKTLENNLDAIAKRSSLIQSVDMERILRIVDTVFDEAELIIRPSELLQQICSKEDQKILSFIFSSLNNRESKEKIIISDNVIWDIVSQFSRGSSPQTILSDKGSVENLDSSGLPSLVKKVTGAVINNDNLLDVMFQDCVLESKRIRATMDKLRIPETVVLEFIDRVLRSEIDKLPQNIVKFVTEETFGGYVKTISNQQSMKSSHSLNVIFEFLDMAIRSKGHEFINANGMKNPALKEIILRVLN